MKKIQILLFGLVFASVIGLFGCASPHNTEEPVDTSENKLYQWGDISGKTITIWGDKDDLNRPYMTRAFERYQKLTGNIIKTTSLSKRDLNEKVPNAFSSDTEEKPDILINYGGTNVENLNPDKNFYDFTNAQWVDDLTDTAINQAIFNGKVIGLPCGEASVSGTIYNKDLFKKFDIDIPTTQDEFMQVCETMLKNGITPLYLPYAEITMLLYQFPMDSFLTDKAILDGLNNNTLSYEDIPEMKKIVEWYKIMSDKGYFGENYSTNTWDGMDGALKSGKYAMMICWDTWLYTSYTGDPSKFGLMPAFIGTPEKGCFEGANIVLCLANKKSVQLDVALDFVNFLADPCNYNIHFKGLYTTPTYIKQNGSITLRSIWRWHG